jgi:hypothetical protein
MSRGILYGHTAAVRDCVKGTARCVYPTGRLERRFLGLSHWYSSICSHWYIQFAPIGTVQFAAIGTVQFAPIGTFSLLPLVQFSLLPLVQFSLLPLVQFSLLPLVQFSLLPLIQFSLLPLVQFSLLAVRNVHNVYRCVSLWGSVRRYGRCRAVDSHNYCGTEQLTRQADGPGRTVNVTISA